MEKSRVKVLVRIKPSPESSPVSYTDTTVTVNKNNTMHTYSFDKVFGPECTTRSVYQHISLKENQSTTILCYGNTSSGKSFTMTGGPSLTGPGLFSKGIVQMVAKKLLKSGSIRVSYFEIYKESTRCLLTKREIHLRERNGEIDLGNAEWVVIKSSGEFGDVLERGSSNRKVGSTCLNTHSSRSHAILQIRTEQGKVSLVDLAGSEDNRRTGNRGCRMEESTSINSSLFVLGKVVKAVVNKEMRIPYRDSKLTRVLQDSIGGDALTYLICNVCQEREFLAETVNTLNFASLSRKVINKEATKRMAEKRETVFDRLASGRSAICTQSAERLGKDLGRVRTGVFVEKQPSLVSSGNPKRVFRPVLAEKNENEVGAEKKCPGTKETPSEALCKEWTGKGSIRKETDLFLTPNTRSKSYKAFHIRALKYELSGQTKKALADYRTLEKISSNEVVREKIRALTRASPTKKVSTNELLDILNSGDFIRTKSLNGVGDKRAQRIVEYLGLGNKFREVRDLCRVFSEKVVEQILSSLEERQDKMKTLKINF